MLYIKNSSMRGLLASGKKIIIYGAGNNFEKMLEMGEEFNIGAAIKFVIDKNRTNRTYTYSGYSWSILGIEEAERIADPKNHILIITIEKYIEVISMLDELKAFDGMESYLWFGFLSVHTGATYSQPFAMNTSCNYHIPKVIHYCWFGDKELGEREIRCINSWKKTNPEYELQKWDQNNFDIASIPYVKEAYEAKKYGFVADYARYDILYRYGGFYFDLDVELLKPIDVLCGNRGVISFESLNLINSGSILAAVSGDKFIGGLKNSYSGRHFLLEDGGYDETPCSARETQFFKKMGAAIDDTYQIVDGVLILPHEVFAPVNQYSGAYELTMNTMGIHNFECSWFEEDMRQEWEERKALAENVNERLLNSWKAEYGA